MTRKHFWIFLALVVSVGTIFNGCSRSNNDTTTTTTLHGSTAYIGTQTPGDVWSWSLGAGTFSATNETTNVTLQGTFTTLASGFLKGVVSITNDPDRPHWTNDNFYMLEYPDTMLLVKPAGTGDLLITCAARMSSTPEVGRYNFVKFPYPGWTTNNKAYGTVEVTNNGDLFNFFITAYKMDGTLKSTEEETGYGISDGRFIRAGSSLEVFMTPSGIFHGDSAGSAGFAGVKNETVTVSDLISKNYRGVLFDYNSSSGLGSTPLIGAGPHPTLANSIKGWEYSDVDNNVTSATEVTLTFGAQDSTGVFSGTRTGGHNTKDFKLVAAKIDGKYIIIGIDAADDHSPENFILVQQ
ncbi:MAG: hypothetical protein WCV91_03605 [Candidatus Margulisiibacteriota bacterium]